MNNSIPRKTRIIDDNVDLAVPEFGGLFNKGRDVLVVEDVANDRNGAVR